MRSPSRYLLVQHHGDGRWYEAGLLDQYRRPDGWWCVVQYRTGPGEQYVLAVPATSCRPLPDQHEDQADDAQPGRDQADHEDDAAGATVARDHGAQR